ncbi:MAG: hypothetical protein WA432_01485 [Candidatus Babeliaceae bacterium]
MMKKSIFSVIVCSFIWLGMHAEEDITPEQIQNFYKMAQENYPVLKEQHAQLMQYEVLINKQKMEHLRNAHLLFDDAFLSGIMSSVMIKLPDLLPSFLKINGIVGGTILGVNIVRGIIDIAFIIREFREKFALSRQEKQLKAEKMQIEQNIAQLEQFFAQMEQQIIQSQGDQSKKTIDELLQQYVNNNAAVTGNEASST